MDYLGELIAIGVDTAILALCLRQYYRQKNTINNIQTAPCYDICTELNEMVSEAPDAKIPYVVLRGTIKSLGPPIISKNSPVNGVVQRVTISEHVMTRASAGFWSEQTRPLHISQNVAPFALSQNNYAIEVSDALSAEILDMDVIWDHYEPSHLGMLDHVWGFFSGVRQKGLQSTEEMLREGALITAIGELSKTEEGTLKLQLPKTGRPLFLTTLTRSALVFKLTDGQNNMRMICAFLGVVGVILCGLLTRKYLEKKEKERKDLRLKDRLEKTRRERRMAARDKNLAEEQLCIVCVHNPKEIILLPCGHVCLCEDCSSQISDNCPVCREQIEQKAAAYIS